MSIKRERGVREYRRCCQTLVQHVVETFDREKANGRLSVGLKRPRDRAVQALGLTQPTLNKLLKAEAHLREPGEPEKRDRSMMMADEDAAVIRPALVALVLERKPISLDSLLARIKEDEPKWKWSRATLQRALSNRCGITFTRRKVAERYYAKMREDPNNVQRRARYLQYFFDYESQGRPFVFIDESWLNKNMVTSKCWSDGTSNCEPDVPAGKGERWILIGAGGKETGWINQSFKMWKGHIQSEDYHTEMNAAVFEDWMKRHLLPYVPGNACIVIDRAPYHTMLTEVSKAAKLSGTRQTLATWLAANGAKDDTGVLLTLDRLLSDPTPVPDRTGGVKMNVGWAKQMMAALASELTPKPQYMVHEWVKEFNAQYNKDIKILLLPVAHPMLNPIESIWSQIKQYVRQNNADHTMPTIHLLARKKQQKQSKSEWASVFDHMRKYAVDQWAADEQLLSDAEDGEEGTEEETSDADAD